MTTAASHTAADASAQTTFSVGDMVIYPSHGLGKVRKIEKQIVAGDTIKVVVIAFEQDRMTLRVPLHKVARSGLRKLSSRPLLETALTTLKGRVSMKRAMWSRRALEYAAKINSGNPVSIAEVVRDLHPRPSDNEKSYSERLIYEQALERLSHEVAAIEKIEPEAATAKLELLLNAA